MATAQTAPEACPFCWYELTTNDAKAAAKFYSDVIGWAAKPTDMDYTLLLAGERMVAGMMLINDEMKARNVPACWTGYIAVPSVDDYVAKVTAAGGALHRPAADIPTVGRFAVVADPHGAGFILFTPLGADPNPPAAPGTPGLFGWRELYSGDLDEAFGFYSKLFGWTKARDHDMGPMGVYRIFSVNGVETGGMMTKPPQVPMPGWNYYINVDAIDAAAAQVTKGNGKVLNGPMQVPGGTWVANCLDPQGAAFSLVAQKK